MTETLGVATTNRRGIKVDEFEWRPDEYSPEYEHYGRLGTELDVRAIAHLECNRGAGYRGWKILILGPALPALGVDLFRIEIFGDSRGLEVAKKDVATITAQVLAAFK